MRLEIIVSKPEIERRSGLWRGSFTISMKDDAGKNQFSTGTDSAMIPAEQVFAALTDCARMCGWPPPELMRGKSSENWHIIGTINSKAEGAEIVRTKIMPTLKRHGLGDMSSRMEACIDRVYHDAPTSKLRPK